MKSRVYQSVFSFVFTVIVIGLLIAGVICTYGSNKFIVMTVITVLVLGFGMIYSPITISVDEKSVNINSPLKIHSIPMRRIVCVERFQPTMGSFRLFGSGGFMGYLGIYREGDIGRYMAYYGKSSDCFLIHLDNGDKYVLGCKNPDAMIDYISSYCALNEDNI